jgi:hypothetical protein
LLSEIASDHARFLRDLRAGRTVFMGLSDELWCKLPDGFLNEISLLGAATGRR